MIPVRESQLPAVCACLNQRPDLAMFPLNNLRRYGLEQDHPLSVRLWARWQGDVATDVLTLTRSGMAMPFLPGADYAAAAHVLRGARIAGIVGHQAWARGLDAALGLTGRRSLDQDEPQYRLDRGDLTVPEGPGRIVPLAQAPREVIQAWMLDYQLNTLHTPPGAAPERVARSYAQYLAEGSHVALMQGDTPLAMTGFNAQIPGMAQVGGVYTPPDLRGRGHARRAVGLHLQQAGFAQAVLFSASEAASRAYRALGFRRVGDWTLMILERGEKA